MPSFMFSGYYGFCKRTERPKQNQKQGCPKYDKTAAYMLWHSRINWNPNISAHQGDYWQHCRRSPDDGHNGSAVSACHV